MITHLRTLPLKAVLLGLALPLLSACPPRTRVSIISDSTGSSLRFGVTGGRFAGGAALSLFLVETCDSEYGGQRDVYWLLEPVSTGIPLSELTYGLAPEGYQTRAGPRLLAGGCYVADFGGDTGVFFVIDSTGMVSTVSRNDARTLVQMKRQEPRPPQR